MKQTSEKIIAAAEERGWINENEILLLKRRRNRGERIQIENPIPVSYDQAQKGFAWLWDKYRTPRGAERKNNPFTNPEEKALEWAKMHGARFTFNGFYGTVNNRHEPIYELITPICDIQYIVTLGQFQRA
jgi:hypothetical protein